MNLFVFFLIFNFCCAEKNLVHEYGSKMISAQSDFEKIDIVIDFLKEQLLIRQKIDNSSISAEVVLDHLETQVCLDELQVVFLAELEKMKLKNQNFIMLKKFLRENPSPSKTDILIFLDKWNKELRKIEISYAFVFRFIYINLFLIYLILFVLSIKDKENNFKLFSM